MFRKTTHIALLLACTALAAPAGALAESTPDTAGQSKASDNLPAIVVTKAAQRHLVDRVVATGSIKPVQEVYIQPLVEGMSIKSLNADTGDVVEANQVLARLNDDSLTLQKSQYAANRAKAEAALAQSEAQMADAKAAANEADRQYDRAQRLGKNGTMSTSQVEQAETSAASAKAQLNSAEKAIAVSKADIKVIDAQVADIDLQLARTDVRTPFAGTVSARDAKVGAIASGSGTPMFTVIRDGQIELVADVPETDILKVKVGQKVTISVAGGAENLTGSVRIVSPTVDATTRLGAIHINIDDDDRARAGMYARAEIVISEADAVALPLSAVNTGVDGSVVRRVEDGVVHVAKIETGIIDDGFVEVKSGLAEGDEVVAKAGAFVGEGDHIRPVDQQQTAASN
ncbi:efflux RND transporter periplasmic adaptor subunit [Rhizobium halophytocola]|nr:efflux RND transporter periplasmic adaptor subunit [Rhizobium halophytocola]